MRGIRIFAAMLPVLLLCGGCFYFRMNDNWENAKRLRVGMTKQEVLEIMGEPLKDEAYNTPDCWYYYTQVRWVDGLATQDECTPLVFENGVLVGWGNEFRSRRILMMEGGATPEKVRKDFPAVTGKQKSETAAKQSQKQKDPGNAEKAPEKEKTDASRQTGEQQDVQQEKK